MRTSASDFYILHFLHFTFLILISRFLLNVRKKRIIKSLAVQPNCFSAASSKTIKEDWNTFFSLSFYVLQKIVELKTEKRSVSKNNKYWNNYNCSGPPVFKSQRCRVGYQSFSCKCVTVHMQKSSSYQKFILKIQQI